MAKKKFTAIEFESVHKGTNKDEKKAKATVTTPAVLANVNEAILKAAEAKASAPASSGPVAKPAATTVPVPPAFLPKATSMGLLNPEVVNKYLQQGLAFAQQGPQSRQQIADSLLGFDIGDYNRGDISGLSMEILSQQGLRNAYYINQHRDRGTFDEPQFLTGEYISLPSKGFLDTQYPLIGAELEKSRQKDEEAKIFESNLQSTRGAWEQLEMEKNNPYMFDPMYGYAMMEYLQGSREEPFNFDQWDYDYQNLPAAEQQERLAKLQAQWNALDFDTLTGRNYKPYQSQTPELEAQYNLIGKEIDKREAADKQSAMLRSHPSYGTPYVAPESKTFPMPSVDQNGNWTFGTYDSNMYDELYLMHSGLSYADLYTAAQNNPKVKWYLDEGLNYMLPEEIAEYKVAKEIGDEEATAWLRNNRSKFLLRRAMVMEEWTKTKAGNPWLAIPSYIDARINNLANVLNVPRQVAEAWLGIDDPNSPAFDQMNQSAWTGEEHLDIINDMEVWEPLKKAVGYVYQGTTSAVDNFTRLAASGFNPTASLIIAGLQSGSASLHESADRDDVSGAAKIIKAIGTGAIEVGTEKIGLDAFFDKGQKNAVNYIKQVFLSELGEEELNALSEPVLEAVVAYLFDHEAEIKSGPEFWQELTDTAITTAISSLLMGGGGAITQSIDNRQTGKTIQQQGDPEKVLEIAKSMPKDSEAYAMAVDIEGTVGKGKKLPLGKLGKLTQTLNSALSEEASSITNRVYEDAIADRLMELGDDSATARKNAPIVRKVASGEKLTVAERTAVAWNDHADKVAKEIIRENNYTDGEPVPIKWVNDAKRAQADATREVMGKQIQLVVAEHTKRNVSTVVAEAVKKGEQKTHKGKDGKPAGKLNARKVYYDDGTNKGEGDILRFEESEGGDLQMVLKADTDGKGEVKVDIGNFTEADGTGTAGLIEAIKDIDENLHKVNAEEASAMLNTYNVGGGDVGQFVENYERAYLAGFSGADGSTVGVTGLDPKLADIAYDAGKRQAEKEEADRLVRVSRARQVETPTVGWLGDVDDNSQIRGTGDIGALDEAVTGMTDGQRYVVEYAKALAEKARINVVLFNSKAGRNGKFTADNGRYDPNTHTIYLDLNAGLNDSKAINAARRKGTLGYAMMRTLGHEVTHAIESTSAEYYAKYKQAVKNALKAKGQDWAVLVRERIDEAIADGKKMTYAEAESEIVADASEYMLQDADFSKNLDTGIVNKIKTVVKNFVTTINDIFRELGNRGSVESYTLREMQDGVYHYMDGLQELWGAAFEEMAGVEGTIAPQGAEIVELSDANVQSSIRKEDPPKKTGIAYKVFFEKNGKLYPPMVANPGGADTPVGVWLNADVGTAAPPSKTGRLQVKAGGKGTQGGSGSLAFRPGWHLGDIPKATQFNRLNKATGVKELFPYNFVWAECEYAMDVDYQEEAMSYGYNASGKFQHSLAGLPRLPVDGYYHYRTNPDPTTVPWVITGAMKVNKILSRAEVDEILREKGVEPTKWQGPDGEQMEADDVKHEYKSQSSSRRDAEYMVAVENGDMEKAQRMTDEAAKAAGYDIVGYHGTKMPTYRYDKDGFGDETDYKNKRLPFTIFKPNPASGIYVASNRAVADGFKKGFFMQTEGTTYKLYVKFDNPFIANEHVWTSVPYYDVIPTPTEMKKAGYTAETVATEEIAQYARSAGYDGVIIEGIKEGFDTQTDDYIAFRPEQIKSADPVTYDDDGNVIPLSERFNVNEADIRHSRRRDYQHTVDGARDFFQDSVSSPDGIDVDNDTGSAYKPQSSARTWRGSDYVTRREEMAQKLSQSIDVPVSTARKWLDDVSSIAAYVLDNKARVDYIPTAVKGVSAFKSNPEYGGSIDMSTICAKRRLATGTLDAIQRVLGDAVLTKDDFLHIREMMKERGYEVACGLCFVESSRKNLSKYNAQFMEQYNSTHPDGEISMTDLNTVDGLEALRLNNEGAYAEYEKFMNKLAQRKPKLFEKRTEYNHEILKKFRSDTTVDIKNLNGGMRLQSFSDFEIVHLIDMMQVITDMASVGLAGQAYTKVPDFAWALGDTGLKINLSLIAKGVDADGNLTFDDVEGMNHNDAKRLRDAYSKNVGTIVVTFTDEQLLAAMKSDMADYIIPFHRSQWQKGDYKKLGLPEGTKDYTLHQNEKQGRKRVKENLLPNAYWDFSLSGKENAEKYLSLCAASGRTPKFAKFLVNNGDGTYSLQPDGSTDGYWKLLIDFKMYDNQGNGSPQLPVQPNFNMAEAMRMLEEYKGEHDSFPVAQDVVDDFVKEYRGDKGGVQKVDGRYTLAPIQSSARRNAPDDISTRDYLAESDDSIAETVEERNALTIYQKLLKNHADASEAVMAAEQALEAAPEAQKAETRKALSEARAKQRDLYNRLLNVERTAHVQSVISRTNQFMTEELQGKTRDAVEKAIADREAKIAELKADLTGLKGAAKTQREADIRQHERIVARFKSKAAQMVLENSEKYQRQIADIRLRRDINIEIGKKTRHIKRVVKALNNRIVHEEDYKNVKEPLKPAVHTLVRTFLDGFGNLVFDQKTAERLRGVYDAIAAEDAAPDFYSDDVANWLTDLASMKELDTLLRAEGSSSLFAAEEKLVMYSRVADIADHIYKMVTDADEIFINGKRASIAAVSGEVGDALVAKPDKPLLVGKAREATRIADDLLLTGNMTPQYFFDHLKNSGLTKLFDGLMDGQQQYAQAIREGQEVIAAAKGKYNFYSWQNMKEGVEFRTEQGHRIALTVPQMMWVYATAKREATNTLMDTHHLDQGGFRYESNALPREKGKMTAIPGSEKLHKLSAKDVAKITGTLTAEQKACADELVAYLSEDCAEMGNEASMKLFGIKKYNEEYYFPFKTASDQRYQNSAAGSTSTTNDARVKHASFTHSLRKGANTPLVMGDFFDVIADHINMMATYSSFVVPIESMNRVLNTKVNEDADGNGNDVTIRSLVGTKYGEPAQKYIADLLKDLNGGPQTDNRGGISALFRAFKRGAVMGSLSVTLQQPTAVARAMAYVNPKYFLHLTGEGNKKTWERMMRYSGTTVIKDMGKFDVGTGKMANDWIANSGLQSYNVWKRGKFLLHTEGWNAVKNNYVDFITALPGVMDRVTWTHIWKAIEAEQADLNPGMDRNSDDFLTIVGNRFDDVVNHTQVYDSILAKSQNMRSKNPLTQMSTAFMSEPTLNINMLYDAIRGEHSGKQRAGIITSVIASNILAAAMASLISAWNKDDDERKWGEKYLTEFASRAIDSVNPLTMIPYVADVWSMINGYDIERTDLSVVKDVIEYTGKFFSNARDPEKANTWRDYENFFGTIANLLGVPAKNISRDIRRVRNLVMTDKSAASGSSLRYSLLETITPFGLYESSNTAYYQRLLAATMDGDKQEMHDLKDYLMSTKGVKESSITSGVRDAYKKVYLRGGITKDEAVTFLEKNGLAKDQKSAFEYVDKWEEGTDGYSAYNTLREAFSDSNSVSIQKAWDELEANGWSNDTIGSYVRGTIIREMVTSGKITPTKATELIRKWYPYKKDKDNVSKPQEWLKSK